MLPPEGITFEVRIETDITQVHKLIQKYLKSYKDEKKGPTVLAIQCIDNINNLQTKMPGILDFPVTQVHVQVSQFKNNGNFIICFCS